MLATLDRDTLAEKRDAALLLLGYACAARVSELAALDRDDAVETEDGLLVSVYRRKLKRHDEVAVSCGSHPATCPVRAVRALLAALDAEGRTAGMLFTTASGSRLDEPAVWGLLRSLARRAGLS
ncbi:tyrosine-type recombinase/integrase [Streptomyces sp. NPDC012461]